MSTSQITPPSSASVITMKEQLPPCCWTTPPGPPSATDKGQFQGTLHWFIFNFLKTILSITTTSSTQIKHTGWHSCGSGGKSVVHQLWETAVQFSAHPVICQYTEPCISVWVRGYLGFVVKKVKCCKKKEVNYEWIWTMNYKWLADLLLLLR